MIRLNAFTAAYWLFWIAGIWATVGALSYEFTTLDPAPIRIGSGLAVGIVVFVLLPMLFRWLRKLKMKVGA
jgi:hypothetical protein